MAGSVNKAIVIGNLGADPDVKTGAAGLPVATFSVATSESWRDKASGERKERTQWHRIVVFSEGLCKIVGDYLKKGSKVYVEGQMETRKWTDQGGIERYTTEVVVRQFGGAITLLDKRGGGVPPNDGSGEDMTRPGSAPRPRTGPGSDIDDDIPF